MFNFKCLFLKKGINKKIDVVDDEEKNLEKFEEEIANEIGVNLKEGEK